MRLKTIDRAIFVTVVSVWVPWLGIAKDTSEQMNERLVLSLPDGWDIGSYSVKENRVMTEWLPPGQTIENWSERITIYVFRAVDKMTVAGFAQRILGNSQVACVTTHSELGEVKEDSKYPMLELMLECEKDDQLHEIRYKLIDGKYNFYVVQCSWRGESKNHRRLNRSRETNQPWSFFLSGVGVLHHCEKPFVGGCSTPA